MLNATDILAHSFH